MNVSTESLLQKIKNQLEKDLIVGHYVKGESLTRKQYNQRLGKAEQEIASGNFLSQEELEKEIENW